MARAKSTSASSGKNHQPTPDLLAFLDILPYSTAFLDRKGTIVFVNDAWRQFSACNEGQGDYVGRNYLKICDTAVGLFSEEAPIVARGLRRILGRRAKGFSLEYACHSRDVQRWFLMDARPFSNGQVAAVVAHMDVTKRKQAELALQASYRRLLLAREEELRHLAREIHDNLAQRLFAHEMSIHLILSEVGGQIPAAASKKLSAIAAESRQILREVRMLSQGFYPTVLEELGLAPAMQRLAETYTHPPLQLKLDRRLKNARFESDVEIAVFRIAQEACSNAVRHSGANKITLQLSLSEKSLTLVIRDNGRGFDIADHRKLGLGLKTMQERAQAIGGRLAISSRPGKTDVRLTTKVRPKARPTARPPLDR